MTSYVKSVAASEIYDFLVENSNNTSSYRFLAELNKKVENVLKSEPKLSFTFKDFGWKGDRFEQQVDFESLKIVLKKKSKVTVVRASYVGIDTTTKSFLPEILMNQIIDIVQVGEYSLYPISTFFEATILIVDISGFTRLSQDFCARGKDGIDGLQQATNVYMGQLVDVIYAYGGDILKFAGDAIICVFAPRKVRKSKKPGNSTANKTQQEIDSQAKTCMKALYCAMELRNIQIEQLSVHVGLSSGEICFGVLGGHDNTWESLISGDCIFHLSQCLDDAARKQVVFTEQCMEMLGPTLQAKITVEKLSSGNYLILDIEHISDVFESYEIDKKSLQLYDDPIFLSVITKFVPFPAAKGLLTNTFDTLAELREVTTMFMKWDSYDSKVHRDLLDLQSCFFAIQSILSLTGGFLRQFLIDDKGCVLIACWGVPTASYIDNAYRALSGSLLIWRDLNKLGMKCSFGVTTGNVYCGSVGCYLRREYAVIGDVVNLAARLMCKAKGGVYTDEATYTRLSQNAQKCLEKLPPIMVKGKTNPIPIFSYLLTSDVDDIVASNKANDYEVRKKCKNIIVPLLENLTSNRFLNSIKSNLKFILIQGKLGSGKKTTVNWFIRQAELKTIRVIHVKLVPGDFFDDYKTMAKLFRQFIKADIFDNEKRQRAAVTQLLKQIYKNDFETMRKVTFPVMKIALGITCTVEMPGVEEMNGDETKHLPPKLVMHALKDIFNFLISEETVTIVMENIQFMDEKSFKTFLSFRNINCKSLILMTSVYPDDFRDTFDEQVGLYNATHVRGYPGSAFEWMNSLHNRLASYEYTNVIELADFAITEIDIMLHNALKVVQYPPGLANMVYQFTGGNPSWVKEMIEFIKSTGPLEFMTTMELELKQQNQMKSESPNEIVPQSPKHKKEKLLLDLFESNKETKEATPVEEVKQSRFQGFARIRSTKQPTNDKKNEKPVVPVKLDRSKLELFVVCRFETLSSDKQRMLRTASVIGFQFSRYILYGILSIKLKGFMFNSIRSLIREHWLVTISGEDDSEYAFSHPLIHKTIYDLTPSSDRVYVHQSIAEYIEEIYPDDPKQFFVLSEHYNFCNKLKALEYCVKSAMYYLDHVDHDIDDCLNIVCKAAKYCSTVVDVDSLLFVANQVHDQFIRLVYLNELNVRKELAAKIKTKSFSLKIRNYGCFVLLLPKPVIYNKISPISDSHTRKLSTSSNTRRISSQSIDFDYTLPITAKTEKVEKMSDKIKMLLKDLTLKRDDFVLAHKNAKPSEWQLKLLGEFYLAYTTKEDTSGDTKEVIIS